MNNVEFVSIIRGIELEDTYLYFYFKNYSRALNQELVRHHYLMNYTIKSTRYTLKELRSESNFKISKDMDREEVDEVFKRSSKYLILTDDIEVNIMSIKALENLRYLISEKGIPNDLAKYALPESYKVEAFVTFNFYTLINFLELRTSKEALWEIRKLAIEILNVLKDKEPMYFELLMENEKIKSNYEKCEIRKVVSK